MIYYPYNPYNCRTNSMDLLFSSPGVVWQPCGKIDEVACEANTSFIGAGIAHEVYHA